MTPEARAFMPPVKMPKPLMMLVPSCGAKMTGFGVPTPWKPGVLSRRSNWVWVGCRPISISVWLQRESVANDVVAAGEIEHSMCLDGFLNGFSAVHVFGYAEGMDVDPFVTGRQGGKGAGRERGQCGQILGLVLHANAAHETLAGDDQAVVEIFHLVDSAFARDLLAAFSKQRE